MGSCPLVIGVLLLGGVAQAGPPVDPVVAEALALPVPRVLDGGVAAIDPMIREKTVAIDAAIVATRQTHFADPLTEVRAWQELGRLHEDLAASILAITPRPTVGATSAAQIEAALVERAVPRCELAESAYLRALEVAAESTLPPRRVRLARRRLHWLDASTYAAIDEGVLAWQADALLAPYRDGEAEVDSEGEVEVEPVVEPAPPVEPETEDAPAEVFVVLTADQILISLLGRAEMRACYNAKDW